MLYAKPAKSRAFAKFLHNPVNIPQNCGFFVARNRETYVRIFLKYFFENRNEIQLSSRSLNFMFLNDHLLKKGYFEYFDHEEN